MQTRLMQRATAFFALLVVCLLTGPTLADAGGRAPGTLTIATYNIHHGVGEDGELDLAEIAAVLSATGASVIGLQEVDNAWSERSDFEDQAAVLAELLGMHFVYGANLDLDPATQGAPRRQYGTAILSAHPIEESSNLLLPNIGGEQRGLLNATIQVGKQSVVVLNTHLQHNNAEERGLQTEAIAAVVDSLDLPVVLVGDLNAVPTDPELHVLRMRLDDVWPLVGASVGFTYPSVDADRRIDYVFSGRCLRVEAASVLPSEASDHLPLTATVRFPRRRVQNCQASALSKAHAHNDYEHARPLSDALDNGFTSVEADLWLVEGQLLVAHDAVDLDPSRTFEALYLEPLAERARKNGARIYPGWPHSVQLLIDIKTEGEATYLAIHEALSHYPELFTRFAYGAAFEGPVTAVISGNRPRDLMQNQRIRYAGYDGRLGDLGDGSRASFIPLISDRWTSHFAWNGEGAMPADEREKLHTIVSTAHENGQRVRFWATPETEGLREAVWAELVQAGVDYFNTDHLPELRTWLLLNDPTPWTPDVDWFERRWR